MRTSERPSQLFPPGAPPDYVRAAQSVAKQATGPSQEGILYWNATKQVSVAIGLEPLAQIECLALRLGISRGRMISQLAFMGLDLVLDQFSDEAAAEFDAEAKKREQQLLSEFSPEEAS